ncbi:MAG: phosphoserine transaminase [Candidatus Paracaedibacteraceae bacterium]|nr:phosphoserine transaminase [Candidatus Paracaedibacteraceae bacterium]
MPNQPSHKPSSPFFGSGPCKKIPNWTPQCLENAFISRSHRAPDGVARVQYLLDLTRQILDVPHDYAIAIIPGSGTGAVETALWNFLGTRPVDVFAWDVFGKLWVTDTVEQLPVTAHPFVVDFGNLPDLGQYNPDHDCVFTWNGTSSGVMIPNTDWIPADRSGLTICDATSSMFAIPVDDWSKLDITCFSWQKALGSEAGHGMIIVSPRALEQLEKQPQNWPIPRLFRLKKDGALIKTIFEAKTINTPSMLCVEDMIQALEWAQSIGGGKALAQRTLNNFKVINEWVNHHSVLSHMATNPLSRSYVSVCINYAGSVDAVVKTLADLGVAYDIKNHFLAPSSFRIWCGPTIDSNDLVLLTQWIDYRLCEENLKIE